MKNKTRKSTDEMMTSGKSLVSRMAQAGAQLSGGMLMAVGGGMVAGSKELSADNVTRLDAGNGVIKGMFEGWMHGLEKGIEAARGSYDTLMPAEQEEATA